ncbi:uncharacterized protein BX664DRAFT_294613 [Halteromyces radiatus]|uniref:uncharacterized protein n=1 Tax=Halteromyces radiatus TaxID=101107 RepID=UPI002220E15A|nr:uncharacterized protein BX664DRAFT_294613 [Halteromyces radiatus]KAI8093101.1 hypothetical protein BX664DRAFT_294613 [Halteromyces radiatus]
MAQKGTGKTLEKLKSSVNDGKYYEAHQMYRTVARRYNKQEKYSQSIKLLHDGAVSLMQHKQSASGSDLANYMMETYMLANLPVDEKSLDRVIDILELYPSTEVGRKAFLSKTFSWTQKNGDYSEGDPELHDYVGTMFYQEGQYSLAEEHLLVGTDHSAELLGELSYTWAQQDANNGNGIYLARVVLQYLAMKSIRHATMTFNSFIKAANLSTSQADFRYSPAGETVKVPTFDDSWLNFTQLVLLTVQRDGSALFTQLKSTYGPMYHQQKGFDDLIDDIGAAFFNIQKPRKQGNIMQDLMNSLFTGGPSTNASRQVTGSPSLGLD